MHNLITTAINSEGRSILASLRAVVPRRSLLFSEALRVAELQANRLLELLGVTDGPVPSEIVDELPRLRIEYRDLPTSGMSFWDGHYWVICLNRTEPRTRQRFTLFHELKHVIDHGRTAQLYPGSTQRDQQTQVEQAADYFAGCLLMPKRLVKRAWGDSLQRPAELAGHFDVSIPAIDVRLALLGLTEPRARCAPPATQRYRTPPRGTYHRQRSARTPTQTVGAAA